MTWARILAGLAVLAGAPLSIDSASSQSLCAVGSTSTITGVMAMHRITAKQDKWGIVLQKYATPCHADIVLQTPDLPAACTDGRRVTATGKVEGFANNPAAPIVVTNRVKCF